MGALLVFLSVELAHGAVFVIADGDVTAFKNAINATNVNGEDDTIELATNGNYVLTVPDNYFNDYNGLPRITADGGKKLTVHGNGTTIQRDTASTSDFRIFYIDIGANVTISRLTITNGVTDDYGGGAVNNVGGALTITDCVLTGNSAYGGGAIFNDNAGGAVTLILKGCTISGNSAPNSFGGGIINFGTGGSASLTVTSCVISNNSADFGGGIENYAPFSGSATLMITDSTLTNNSAIVSGGGGIHNNTTVGGNATLSASNTTFDGNSAPNGGAIANSAGNVQITNCTLSANSAGSGGGTYSQYDGAVLQITNCTFSGNVATGSGGGAYNDPSGTTITRIGNTILQAGTAGGTIGGMGITSQGHNISSDAAGGFLAASGDQINTDPKLDPNGLQNNGGPTKTIALLASSPAINAGNDANAPARDQRYYLRNGSSDIGAFEYGGALATISAASRKTHGSAGFFDVDLPLNGNLGIECRSRGATGDHQLVLTFATSVTVNGSPQAQVTSGAGQVGTGGISNGGMVSVNAAVVTVPLTNVSNAQKIVITLSGVSDGSHTNNVSVPMGVLLGDTTANGLVNSSDIAQTQSQSGQAVTSSNFRQDVTVNGLINSSDISSVQSQSGVGLSLLPIDQKSSRSVVRPRSRVINN